VLGVEPRLEYPSWSSYLWRPFPVIAKQGIRDDDEFPHDGNDGDFAGFPA
jgi:hypothetical protein